MPIPLGNMFVVKPALTTKAQQVSVIPCTIHFLRLQGDWLKEANFGRGVINCTMEFYKIYKIYNKYINAIIQLFLIVDFVGTGHISPEFPNPTDVSTVPGESRSSAKFPTYMSNRLTTKNDAMTRLNTSIDTPGQTLTCML